MSRLKSTILSGKWGKKRPTKNDLIQSFSRNAFATVFHQMAHKKAELQSIHATAKTISNLAAMLWPQDTKTIHANSLRTKTTSWQRFICAFLLNKMLLLVLFGGIKVIICLLHVHEYQADLTKAFVGWCSLGYGLRNEQCFHLYSTLHKNFQSQHKEKAAHCNFAHFRQ